MKLAKKPVPRIDPQASGVMFQSRLPSTRPYRKNAAEVASADQPTAISGDSSATIVWLSSTWQACMNAAATPNSKPDSEAAPNETPMTCSKPAKQMAKAISLNRFSDSLPIRTANIVTIAGYR